MDNDVILKLAGTQLLDDWGKIAWQSPGEVRVLPTAAHFFRKKKALLERYGANAVKAAIAFATQAESIREDLNSDTFTTLLAVPGIDPGEAILYTAALKDTDFLVLSGDKTSLRALHTADTCSPIRAQMSGRVIAFEQIMLALINRGNFSAIREYVVAAEKVDTVLRVAFGLGLETTKASAVAALENYLGLLRKETGGLLIVEDALEAKITL